MYKRVRRGKVKAQGEGKRRQMRREEGVNGKKGRRKGGKEEKRGIK